MCLYLGKIIHTRSRAFCRCQIYFWQLSNFNNYIFFSRFYYNTLVFFLDFITKANYIYTYYDDKITHISSFYIWNYHNTIFLTAVKF